jgi:hypothetical protein
MFVGGLGRPIQSSATAEMTGYRLLRRQNLDATRSRLGLRGFTVEATHGENAEL